MYGPEYQASTNIRKMDYKIVKMRKITKRKLGTDDKIVMFKWIAERIAAHGEYALGL